MKSKIWIPFLFTAFIGIADPARATAPEQRAGQIKAAMDSRNFDQAERLVRALGAENPVAFKSDDYDYLLGRLAERRGLLAEAGALYQQVLSRGSDLAAYAEWHLSMIARQSGDLAAERDYLSRVLAGRLPQTIASKARERLAENLIESGNYKTALRMVEPLAAGSREEQGLLADIYLRSGDKAAAAGVFHRLVEGSRDDYALKGALGLDQIDNGSRLSEFDALQRARIYLENRHWPEAARHLLYIISNFPNSPNRAEALYGCGFALYRQDKYDDAIKWFQRAHDEFPEKKEGQQGYYWVGTALQKAGRWGEAAMRYADFIGAYPDSELLGRAYLNVVDCYRYAGSESEAISWAQRMEQRFAGQPLGAVAVFDRARIEMALGAYETALALLTRLEANPVSSKVLGSPGPGEAGFLKAYCLEQMGRLSEAVDHYLAIPDVRDGYFGRRATLRLAALAATDKGRLIIEPLERASRDQARAALSAGDYRQAKDAATRALRLGVTDADRRYLLDILKTCYSNIPAYSQVYRYHLIPIVAPGPSAGASHSSLAARLISLGIYDEGAAELRISGIGAISKSEAAGAPDAAYSMAVYSNRGDQAHYAIEYAEPLFRSVPRDCILALLPRDLAEMLYPAPFRDILARYSAASGVDPRVVLSLARQESRFDAHAKSSASARGVVQLIPETAERLAREEGISNFKLDDAYDPAIAFRLTARYVGDLNRLFPSNPYAIAASYDSGEEMVERWISRSRSNDVDRFVAEIPIPETKDYVAKVLSNYWAYQELYTVDLKPM